MSAETWSKGTMAVGAEDRPQAAAAEVAGDGASESEEVPAVELLSALRTGCPFGPLFFMTHLQSLIRQRCPESGEARPIVLIHLMGGDVLDVCHVIGLAPGWVALAVHDDHQPQRRAMRTEMVPYAAIVRVTIRAGEAQGPSLGFDAKRAPSVIRGLEFGDSTAEDLLNAARRGLASPAG